MKYILTLLFFILIVFFVKAQQPRLMLPIGHSDYITSVEFSKDEKLALTTSRDGSAKIWEVQSGKLLGTLEGHTDEVTSASFNPDGSKIVTSSLDGTARIWDAKTGVELLKIDHGKHKVFNAAYHFVEDIILTNDGTARIWDAKTGKPKYIYMDKVPFTKAFFSYDGRFVITQDQYQFTKAWPAIMTQPLTAIEERIVAAGNPVVINYWQPVQNGQAFSQPKINYNLDYKISRSGTSVGIFNSQTKTQISTLNGSAKPIRSFTLNPKGSSFALLKAGDSTFSTWDFKTGKFLKLSKKLKSRITSINFSPDGKFIATQTTRNQSEMIDAVSGISLYHLDGNFAGFNTNGKSLLIGTGTATAKILSVSDGQILKTITSPDSTFTSLNFSEDGSKIISIALQKNPNPKSSTYHYRYLTRIWEVATGKMLTTYGPQNQSFTLANKSATTLLMVDSLYRVTIFNALTGKKITELKVSNKKAPKNNDQGILTSFPSTYFSIVDAIYSKDETTLITISIDQKMRYWEVQTGKILKELDLEGVNYSSSLSFGANDNQLLLTTGFATKMINLNEGNIVRFDGHTASVNAVNLDQTKAYLLSSSNDGTVKVFNVATTKLMYTLAPINESDYLIIDSEGRYEGSSAARKLVYLVCGSEIIELDQVKDQLWSPDLAEHIMAGEKIQSPGISALNICNFVPEVETEIDGEKDYKFKIRPGKGGLGESILYLNDIEFKRYKVDQLQKTSTGYELQVTFEELNKLMIPGKENQILLKALTTSNAISSRGVKVIYNAKNEASQAPNLYAVVIGVSDYKASNLTLKYAAKDATDFAKVLSASAKKLLNTDGKEHVFTYNLTTTSKDLQSAGKTAIKNTLDEIGKKANPSDLLLIFFAGHGAMDSDTKKFFLLTSDVSSIDNFKETGISTAELSEWMKPENIKAQKRVLIFDACNSGQAINELVKVGGANQQYLAARNDDKAQQMKAIEKLNEKSGLFILSASASNQSAYEMGKYSQGFLTYALLKSIKEQPAILDDNKYLNVGNWFRAAEQMVTDIAKENGARQQPQVVSMSNFNIGVVDQEIIGNIILPQEKALFAPSNFQNSDETIADDDLDLSKEINLSLNNISSRSTDAKISYSNSTNSPDAYALSGRYEVKAENILVKVNIRKNKELKYKFEITGKKANLSALANEIVKQAATWAEKK